MSVSLAKPRHAAPEPVAAVLVEHYLAVLTVVDGEPVALDVVEPIGAYLVMGEPC